MRKYRMFDKIRTIILRTAKFKKTEDVARDILGDDSDFDENDIHGLQAYLDKIEVWQASVALKNAYGASDEILNYFTVEAILAVRYTDLREDIMWLSVTKDYHVNPFSITISHEVVK